MRILMVTDTYAPARNGVAMWASLSVRELRSRGHEVDVLTYHHDRREPHEPGMHEMPAWIGLDPDFKVAPILSGLPGSVTESRWDVVHVHHPILLGPHGVELARRVGAKVAFTCHSVYSDYLDEYYWGVGRFMKPALNRSVARFVDSCDLAFAPSSCVARWLRGNGVTTRIELLEAPADTHKVRPLARTEARASLDLGDEPVAFFVGRIADEKRVHDLVREFVVARRRVPDARLVLAGGGRRLPAVRRQVERLGLGDTVRLLGPQPIESLARWYSAADIAVSASRSETGPITVVEAMACGCPTVALRAPGFEDRIVDGVNGLLAPDEPGALGERMAAVLGDPGLRATLSQGAAAKAGCYTPECNTDRLVEMYEQLLS